MSCLFQDVGIFPVVAEVRGIIKRLGSVYSGAHIILVNKENMQPIAATRSGVDGYYRFSGLNNALKTVIVAFDMGGQYNAVIQDNVRPK